MLRRDYWLNGRPVQLVDGKANNLESTNVTTHLSLKIFISRWEKGLLKFLEKTTIGKVGPDKIDDEIRRITRYEEWCNLVEDSESEDDEEVSHGRNNEARGCRGGRD
jgi:hypothetical protein